MLLVPSFLPCPLALCLCSPLCRAGMGYLSRWATWKRIRERAEAEKGHVKRERESGERRAIALFAPRRRRRRTNASVFALFRRPFAAPPLVSGRVNAPFLQPRGSARRCSTSVRRWNELKQSREGCQALWRLKGGGERARGERERPPLPPPLPSSSALARAPSSSLTLILLFSNFSPNRPVAYAPAEKERSANANAIKFAADLLAGGVAGGISKTGELD